MGDISKPLPVCGGDQRSITAPCGKATKANRFGVAAAAVCAQAVEAGLIASRNGSAIAAPTPLSTVRREMCFCDKYICVSVNHGPPKGGPYGRPLLQCRLGCRRRLRHPPHPELIALHH